MKDKDISSLEHTRWRCQYHIVFAPKYRRMVVYGQYRGMPNVEAPQFTTVGTGRLDLCGCVKAGAEEDIEWAIVEQDFPNILQNKEILTAAYLNMKETGYIE